jgi:hypothetical protein
VLTSLSILSKIVVINFVILGGLVLVNTVDNISVSEIVILLDSEKMVCKRVDHEGFSLTGFTNKKDFDGFFGVESVQKMGGFSVFF